MSARRGDAGFTLVELLVAVAILGIISTVLTESLIQAVRTTDGTTQRYAESQDRVRVAGAFVPDVESAERILGPSAASVLDTCTDGATVPVLRMEWTDSQVLKVATYTLAAGGEGRQLIRRYCEEDLVSPTPQFVLVRKNQVANFVSPADNAVTLSCDGDATCPSDTPRSVTTRINQDPNPGSNCDPDAQGQRPKACYDVTASRRTP